MPNTGNNTNEQKKFIVVIEFMFHDKTSNVDQIAFEPCFYTILTNTAIKKIKQKFKMQKICNKLYIYIGQRVSLCSFSNNLNITFIRQIVDRFYFGQNLNNPILMLGNYGRFKISCSNTREYLRENSIQP